MQRAATLALFICVLVAVARGQKDHGPPPSSLAQKCGAEVAWQPSLEAALARAREIDRPVFWYVATVPRSPMDRKPVIDMYMRAGPFSMPDVVAALNRRFVPVAARPSRAQAEERALKPNEFIEPGFLLLRPDGTEIARVDRITTFHELWFVEVLNVLLQGEGALARPTPNEPGTGVAATVRSLRLDGLWRAAAALPAAAEEDAYARYERALVAARLGDVAGAAAIETRNDPDALVERGLFAMRREDWPAAEALFAKVTGGAREAEARYLRGAALLRMGRRPDAVAGWKELAASSPDSPWAAKAAAEAEGHGPFGRGFEEYGYLRPDATPKSAADVLGTQRARTPEDQDYLVRRSLRYLLETQDPDGGFEDSNYDYGGRDSLPDVYVAVTALCGLAIHEWSTLEPERATLALARALDYVADEAHVATDNTQERVWAHAYRVLFLSRLAETRGPLQERAAAKLRDVAKRLHEMQDARGQFAHEYPNPFATATALHALRIAERGGATVPRGAFERGAAALRGARGDDGAFSYGFGRRPGASSRQMAGGRMPTCEHALLLCGASSQEKLAAAIRTSHEHHGALEQVRKYDDHAPPYGIGGFFYWYDVYGRCLAIAALDDAARKAAFFEQERRTICSIAEIDGRFVDSHELGKPYGTAMALLSLRVCAPPGP